MGHHFFISHSSKDIHAVEEICELLTEAGATYWLSRDHIKPGDEHSLAIPRAIKNSRVVLVVFSRSADRSRHISRELTLADDYARKIVPVRLESYEPRLLRYYLKTAQWVDFHGAARAEGARRLSSLAADLCAGRKRTAAAAPAVRASAAPAPAASRKSRPEAAKKPAGRVTRTTKRSALIPNDPEHAFRQVDARANADKVAAAEKMWRRGVACCTRKKPDFHKARQWFEKAAAIEKRDFAEAIDLFTASSKAGNPEAMVSLGVLFEAGTHVPRDYSAARLWLEKAAHAGSVEGMCRFGMLLARGGDRESPNYKRAEHWIRMAANKGHAEAMYQMGRLFTRRHDLQNARRWYEQAAARGHVDANYELRIG